MTPDPMAARDLPKPPEKPRIKFYNVTVTSFCGDIPHSQFLVGALDAPAAIAKVCDEQLGRKDLDGIEIRAFERRDGFILAEE